MPKRAIDDYLAGLDPPARDTLQELRDLILDVVPEAEEGIAYGVPVFRVDGSPVAGFAAFKDHLSYLPHSGTVLARLGSQVADYTTSKGALQFPLDRCLPADLVQVLVEARMEELAD